MRLHWRQYDIVFVLIDSFGGRSSVVVVLSEVFRLVLLLVVLSVVMLSVMLRLVLPVVVF